MNIEEEGQSWEGLPRADSGSCHLSDTCDRPHTATPLTNLHIGRLIQSKGSSSLFPKVGWDRWNVQV